MRFYLYQTNKVNFRLFFVSECSFEFDNIMSNIKQNLCFPVPKSIHICAVILTTLDLILISLLFYKGIKFIMFHKTIKLILIPYIIICISSIIHILLSILFMLISNSIYCLENLGEIVPYINGLLIFFYFVCILNGYLLYLVRLKISFNNTNQALSQWKYILFILLYIIANLSNIIATALNLVNLKISRILIYIGSISPMIYLVSSIVLCILFLTKSIKLSKNTDINPQIKYIRLGSVVKYLNCVFVTFISTIITTTIGIFMTSKASHNSSFVPLSSWLFIILSLIDGFFNVFFLHLQFKFMKSWYHALCNPFRMEINSILNKNITGIELTIQYDKTVSPQNNTVTSDTNTKSSTIPIGLEPTKTNDLDNHIKTLPNDNDLPNAIQYNSQYYPHYFCRLCPFQSDY